MVTDELTKIPLRPDNESTAGQGQTPKSIGAVGAADFDVALAVFVGGRDAQLPGVAAHLAVLDEQASYLWFQVNFDRFATIRTGHHEDGLHRYMMRHRHEGLVNRDDHHACQPRPRNHFTR